MGRRGFFYLVTGLVVGLLVAQLPGTFANMGMGGSGMMGPMHGRGTGGGMMMGHMMQMMHGDMGTNGRHGDCPMMTPGNAEAMLKVCSKMATAEGMAECPMALPPQTPGDHGAL